MKNALNAWSCPSNHDFETVFRTLKAAGFDGVELNVDGATNASAHSLTLDVTDAELSRIRELSERYGLPVASISTSLYGPETLGADRAEDRAMGCKILETQMRCAKVLGADGILVVPGGIGENRSILRAWENAQETLASMKSVIEGGDVKVGVENVWNGFFMSPVEMARFIDELNIRNLGAYFDVGNVEIFSYPEYWIEALGRRIVKIHVKDFLRTGANAGTFVNLLEGSIRWGKVMEALRAAGYDGFITAELGGMPETPEYLYRITKDALDVIRAL